MNYGSLIQQILLTLQQSDAVEERRKRVFEFVLPRKRSLSGRIFSKVILTSRFKNIVLEGLEGITEVLKPKYSFSESFCEENRNVFRNSILLVNNNDLPQEESTAIFFRCLRDMQEESPLVICWDWDNQHGVEHAFFLADIADCYFGCSYDNIAFLSDKSQSLTGVQSIGTIQFSTAFIKNNLDSIKYASRENSPGGSHNFYAVFDDRNRKISLLNQSYPGIRFATDYESKSPEQNLFDWIRYKCSVSVPVITNSQGLPIRFFDTLITGGVPILPMSLVDLVSSLDLLDHVVFYDSTDFYNFSNVVQRAICIFDDGGIEGIEKRVTLGLSFHSQNGVRRILDRALAWIGSDLSIS